MSGYKNHADVKITSLFPVLAVFLTLSICGGMQLVEAAPRGNDTHGAGKVWLDVIDPIGDDKGPGYYQYPLDRRLRRGTFDLRRFTVSEDGNAYIFKIQMREYIMTEWPDTRRSEEQGFVALAFDIYIDLNGRPGSGYHESLPGRDVVFADDKGWDKVIMATPYSQTRVDEILQHKTDDLSFQDLVPDIILPDYVRIQRDTIIVSIGRDQIGQITEQTGFQCFIMGFSHVVSVNRLLNRDVRAFATADDFGGGWDTRGDPPIMDMIVPPGADQYALLRDYRSEPYRDRIEYAQIPFVYVNSSQKKPSSVIPTAAVSQSLSASSSTVGSGSSSRTSAPNGAIAVHRSVPQKMSKTTLGLTSIADARPGLSANKAPAVSNTRLQEPVWHKIPAGSNSSPTSSAATPSSLSFDAGFMPLRTAPVVSPARRSSSGAVVTSRGAAMDDAFTEIAETAETIKAAETTETEFIDPEFANGDLLVKSAPVSRTAVRPAARVAPDVFVPLPTMVKTGRY